MDGLCTLNYAMVEIHAPKTVPRLVSYTTIPKTGCISRRRFMFHAVYTVLEEKIYSTGCSCTAKSVRSSNVS